MSDSHPIDILLVEDNLHDAELTIRVFKKNYLTDNIVHVEDGVEALDFIFAQGMYVDRNMEEMPKVILLDIKLPRINGLEVLSAIKANERTRLIPVVVVTSSDENPDIAKAYQLGANSYVIKPVQSDTFSDVMARLGMYWLRSNYTVE